MRDIAAEFLGISILVIKSGARKALRNLMEPLAGFACDFTRAD
jgi:hypothetical protein